MALVIIKYEWKTSSGTEVKNSFQYMGVMEDEDVIVILKGTANNCLSWDTARIYYLPEVPVVNIDTNQNRDEIKIHWERVKGSDKYTVYSREWDPYCTLQGGQYEICVRDSALSWIDNTGRYVKILFC